MPERQFPKIAEELKQTAARLKEATDPSLRHELLQRMRLLLWEADMLMTHREPSNGFQQ
jgi:hypothetical protein